MNEQTLKIADSCTINAVVYENGNPDVYISYIERSPDSWYSDRETYHDLDPVKIREIIDFLAPFAELSPTLSDSFSVTMSEELAQEFEDIQRDTRMNGAEVFRRAIALYKIAKKAIIDGEQVILKAKDRERLIEHI